MKDEQEPEDEKPKKPKVKAKGKGKATPQPKISPADREKERKGLINSADEITGKKWLDSGLDKKNEKDRVSGYRELAPTIRFISAVLQEYGRKFERPFYFQLYRLKGVPMPEKLSKKPWWVARRTVQLIYDRFHPTILPELRRLNPYGLDGCREYKHFQRLTDEGVLLLLEYIDDAIKVMQRADNWTHALRMMDKEHGLPYQPDIFED